MIVENLNELMVFLQKILSRYLIMNSLFQEKETFENEKYIYLVVIISVTELDHIWQEIIEQNSLFNSSLPTSFSGPNLKAVLFG